MKRKLIKANIAMKELLVEIQILQVILVKIQKEKRWRESICLRRVYMYLHTIIMVEVWMQNTILMRSQTEMRNS